MPIDVNDGAISSPTTPHTVPLEHLHPMQHSDFNIGLDFYTSTGKWRCTDIGSRTIICIKLEFEQEPSWYNGPPYAVIEHAFNEYDFGGCSLDWNDVLDDPTTGANDGLIGRGSN